MHLQEKIIQSRIAFLHKTKHKVCEHCQNSGFKYISFLLWASEWGFLNATMASIDTRVAGLGQSSGQAADDKWGSLIQLQP